ncbi:hypothetical protein K1719_039764 [Acacia pycnantha]|nr:hypothetical protein K1719_039764 [Acacia pycnantha]
MKEQAITVDNDDGSDEEESEYACVRVIGRRYLEAVCCWIMNEFTTAKLQSAPPPPSPPIDIPFISLISVIEANREVLDKYKICRRWNFWLAPYFQRKLDEEYQSLQRDCSIQMQTQIARDLKRVLYKLSSDDDDRNSLRSESISSRESKRIRTQTFKGDLEIFPEFTVGLDGPVMKELKSKLLHGDEQVLNLYGLAGSGKTTLAKNFVMVPKSKLKNIFFVTLGSQFRGDEAINDLQDRLPKFGANLVLLVLDDVWPASEKIVEEFRVRMSTGSKIFVTSRVPVTRLGIRFPMEQLSEDDAVALFLHFVQQSNINFDSRYGSSLWGQCRGLLFKVRYGSYSLGGKYCHKMALRILLASIELLLNGFKPSYGESIISTYGEGWAINYGSTSDAQDSPSNDMCLLLVLEHSWVEVADSSNELAFTCWTNDGNFIDEATLTKLIHHLTRLLVPFLIIWKMQSYLAEAHLPCKEKVQELLGFMLYIQGEDEQR